MRAPPSFLAKDFASKIEARFVGLAVQMSAHAGKGSLSTHTIRCSWGDNRFARINQLSGNFASYIDLSHMIS
jgi:hypothetical protein